MTQIKMTWGSESVTVEIGQPEQSIKVDGVAIGRQSADGSCRVADCVRIAARYVWPEGGDFASGSDEWDELEYETLSKDDAHGWEPVSSYVSTYPEGDDTGACDVAIEVGRLGRRFVLRTTDEAGGSDDLDDTEYDSRESAVAAAESEALERTDAAPWEDAESYLTRLRHQRAGEPIADGVYCVYWESSLEDSGPRERYATREQAESAASIAQDALESSHPGDLLCGYSVRALVGGEWVSLED